MVRLPRIGTHRVVLIVSTALFVFAVWAIWLGVNSDKDNIHPLLNQLIPAGHCACQTSTVFQCDHCLQCSAPIPLLSSAASTPIDDYSLNAKNLALNASQCQAFLPGLFQDPYRAQDYWTDRGGIRLVDLDNIKMVDSMARVAIQDGQLYIVRALSKGEDHRRKILGILSSIHRALVTAPDPAAIPNTEFIFSVEDKLDDVAGSGHPLWMLARKATEEAVWLMPDFGFWSWNNDNLEAMIGPFDRVVDHIEKNEVPWHERINKLVWRGKLSFAPKLRRTLLEVARGQPWGDIKDLEWKNKANFLSMEDHCKYRFIAHVEGRSYSSSLKYRQACRSVIVIHKLQYIQHNHYLLVSSGPHQNYVEVERDFSDLQIKMQDLIDHPDKAQKIADNSVSVFRGRYLSPRRTHATGELCWKHGPQLLRASELTSFLRAFDLRLLHYSLRMRCWLFLWMQHLDAFKKVSGKGNHSRGKMETQRRQLDMSALAEIMACAPLSSLVIHAIFHQWDESPEVQPGTLGVQGETIKKSNLSPTCYFEQYRSLLWLAQMAIRAPRGLG
ncbi:glycosyl transferase family 90-domain-containing protein [Penicillium mononematosum]|uniref:glycosyl transferase family 90-domain-containing protein n=1 Tax=Penicillium mononematosum TaxID=268346 RepID=UPI0025489340|nr:glycosyl transferase family 90-domain-containing protein [Penicillium mononematosum]KAJ6178269.1 glycosyl transferase family 90-domain-containing protein [Penicillium mononematosum]